MEFKREFIWDYNISDIDTNSDSFRKWYIARVLVRGTLTDLRQMGFNVIYEYLPALTLPFAVRKYWDWYFSIPNIKSEYGHIEQKPATGFKSPVRSRIIKK